jgi:CheY-like chemotaxis protein
MSMTRYKHILLVDDDEDDQYLFARVVSRIQPSATLSTAANGRMALELLPRLPHPPDLIFLDLNMPVMNGMEFLSAIKTDEAYRGYKDIPVVILGTSIADPEKCYAEGACLAITKQTSMELYRDILAKLIKHDIAKECETLRERMGARGY